MNFSFLLCLPKTYGIQSMHVLDVYIMIDGVNSIFMPYQILHKFDA